MSVNRVPAPSTEAVDVWARKWDDFVSVVQNSGLSQHERNHLIDTAHAAAEACAALGVEAARAEGRQEAVREIPFSEWGQCQSDCCDAGDSLHLHGSRENYDRVAGLNASESPTPMHDSSDHDCRGGVEGDRYPFTGDASESPPTMTDAIADAMQKGYKRATGKLPWDASESGQQKHPVGCTCHLEP